MATFWECDRCTACCRWPGQVLLSEGEITRIAEFLGLTESDFIQQYTRLNRERTGLALVDREDFACVFLEGDNCRIQAVKPQQCRDFPNLWNFPGFQKVCQAKPIEVPEEIWRERIERATGKVVLHPPVLPPVA
ncbi:MAG TPA: YkgJ family cysteine cluster protein [Candidatus Limnocylindria bacterium]|jgi:Fe-S-cluster containining protein|nr:YkgJ family cysteine cluster protein [Candidatus Limnocylindria bacterium]